MPFRESCGYGRAHLDDIVEQESVARRLPREMVREYFERNVTLEFTEREYQGLQLFLRYVGELSGVKGDGA